MKERIIAVSNATEAIRNAAENNPEDKYREFRAKWNPVIDEIKRRFYPDFWTPGDKFELPTAPLAIEDMRNMKWLASYRTEPDGYGLNDKLTINEKWVVEKDGQYVWYWGDQELVETLVHEIGHEKMNYLIKQGKQKPMSNPHGKPFQKMMLQLGIYCNDKGQHEKPCDNPDSPVGILLKDLGIPMIKDFPEATDKGNYWEFKPGIVIEKKGRSTLTGWVCPECNLKVRIGIKGNPELSHDPCSEKLGRRVNLIRLE